MKRIDPLTLRGPRVYITDFDPIILGFKDNKDEYLKEIELRLKVNLLTKSTVVCAASHLASEFIYPLFRENPFLLSENLVIPALRKDVEQIDDYFDNNGIKSPLKEEITNFYENSLNKTINWEIYENTKWFKEKMLKGLNDQNSVLRRNLMNISKSELNSLVEKIKDSDVLRRGDLIAETSNWPSFDKSNLMNFSIMVYHISGARVVNCESFLPQENYIDYSLFDFTRHRTALSETQIFLKIFWELGLEILHGYSIPVECIDSLSFEDIHELRKPIEKSSFQEKYDRLIREIMQNTETDVEIDSFIYEMEKPYDLLVEIYETLNKVLNLEFPRHFEKKKKINHKGILNSSASLGIGLSGLIPQLSIPASIYGLSSASRELLINLSQISKNKKENDYYEFQRKNKRKIINSLIKKSTISKDSPLLDTIELFNNVICERKKL